MDLWIRSQSRETLIKAGKIFAEDEEVYAKVDNEFGERIGVYKTKERALEILDEIQNILQPKISVQPIIEEDINPKYIHKHFVSNGKEVDIVEFSTYVYKMPIE